MAADSSNPPSFDAAHSITERTRPGEDSAVASPVDSQSFDFSTWPSPLTSTSASPRSAFLERNSLPRRRSSFQSQTHPTHTTLHVQQPNRGSIAAPRRDIAAKIGIFPRLRPFKLLLLITPVSILAFLAYTNLSSSTLRISELDFRANASQLHRTPVDQNNLATSPLETTSIIPSSCEPCILNPKDPLCKYGLSNIRLSRMYEGSGHRVKRVMEKALRGERISISIIGGSISRGHGLHAGQWKWRDVFLLDWLKSFPNTTVYDGAQAGMNSDFFSYCFDNFVPPTSDLYFVELDVNNKYDEATYSHDDALYRGLLHLPQRPAVVRIGVFGILPSNLQGGTPSALVMSNFFDVPMIGNKNYVLPYLLLHPNETERWFFNDRGWIDTRHMNDRGHRSMGDMLALYFRKMVCETRQELANPILPTEEVWPGEEILNAVPDAHLWSPWSPESGIPVTRHTCSLSGNKWRPLKPLPSSSPSWTPVQWNDKSALSSSEIGAQVSFSFSGCKIRISVWLSKGVGNTVKPGKALCFVDGVREGGKLLDAFVNFDFSYPQWYMVRDDLSEGEHTLTCEISSDSSTDGHEFRIIGIGSQ
ncbi:hypothetical protein P7C70_g5618, partial [Phenoliferia sp. Uapishka_3]